jgi:glycerol-3-phosphate acyltransferase PlsX
MKAAIFSSFISKIGGLMLKKPFNNMMDKMDYTKHGGAVMLGVSGTVIKAHGSSNAVAFYNAVRQAVRFFESGVNERIVEEFLSNK